MVDTGKVARGRHGERVQGALSLLGRAIRLIRGGEWLEESLGGRKSNKACACMIRKDQTGEAGVTRTEFRLCGRQIRGGQSQGIQQMAGDGAL